MRIRRAFVTAMLLATLLVTGGCVSHARVHVADDVGPNTRWRVGVLDFVDAHQSTETILGGSEVTRIPEGGLLVADAVATALVRVPQFQVVERERMMQVLRQLEIDREQALTPEHLHTLAQAAGVDAVVVGTVHDFHWWQVALSSGSRLSFTARMVRADDGQVMWSAACDRDRSKEHSELLHDLAAKLAYELADELE